VIVICSKCRAQLYSINWIITLITIAGFEKQEVFPALHGHATGRQLLNSILTPTMISLAETCH